MSKVFLDLISTAAFNKKDINTEVSHVSSSDPSLNDLGFFCVCDGHLSEEDGGGSVRYKPHLQSQFAL